MPIASNSCPAHIAPLTPEQNAVPGVLDARARRWSGSLWTSFLAEPLELFVGRADADALEVLAERPLRLADAHAVVVQDDQHLPLERAGVVEPFERQAVDDRRIADDGDDVVVFARACWSPRAMPTAVLMAVPAWPTANRSYGDSSGAGNPAIEPLLAQLVELPGPAGEHLVRVALVPDVEQQPVRPGRVRAEVVDVVQGERELDHAEVGGEVPAVLADGVEDAVAHFAGERLQLVHRHLLEIGWGLDAFELTHHGRHVTPPAKGAGY